MNFPSMIAGAGGNCKKCPTAKKCLYLYRERQFVECKKDLNYLEKSISIPIEFNTLLLINNRSSLKGNDQLKKSIRLYLAAMKRGRLKESLNSLRAPFRLSFIHILQDHVVPYLCVLHLDSSPIDVACHIPNTGW